MPISPRLSGSIYGRLLGLIRSANHVLFFGTYSISRERGIMNQIIRRKQAIEGLHVACLLPPPTDFILWDFAVRGTLLRAYGLTRSTEVELARAIAENPQPAYSVLDDLWTRSTDPASRSRVTTHIRRIAELYTNGVVVFLEPNMHAKFLYSEEDIYEGSANLTQYGLNVNVEVYNFYPARYPRIYHYASQSYTNFLISYLNNFVDWKLGEHFLTHANQLGSEVEQLAISLGIVFNPKVTREKIETLAEVRDKLSNARSQLWQLQGHKLVLSLDLLMRSASIQIQATLSRLWSLKEEEIDREVAGGIESDLSKTGKTIQQIARVLKELRNGKPERQSWYESEYLSKSLAEAKSFLAYLEQLPKKDSQ